MELVERLLDAKEHLSEAKKQLAREQIRAAFNRRLENELYLARAVVMREEGRSPEERSLYYTNEGGTNRAYTPEDDHHLDIGPASRLVKLMKKKAVLQKEAEVFDLVAAHREVQHTRSKVSSESRAGFHAVDNAV